MTGKYLTWYGQLKSEFTVYVSAVDLGYCGGGEGDRSRVREQENSINCKLYTTPHNPARSRSPIRKQWKHFM
ncbi:hypothetical protein J6590_016186 [Homalodisca vitripennis]|nr:hypothetical protein J6590_016186 [Homalodisca vitripennis]